jgi:asparagine synthase (glutamine-hydrolysing)
MRSDVPIGAFLSGGLDSSTVVGIMRKFTELNKLNTFSIGFRNEFDETKYINIVKNYFKTIHHNYIFENDHFTKWIDRTTFHYDEPFADFSLFPTFQVSEMAKKKVTVVLSGDGGDEVFGGYNIYKIPLVLSILRIMPKMFRKNIKKIIPSTKIRNILEKSLKNNTEFYSSSSKNITFKKWASKCMKYCLKKSKNNLSEALRIFDILFNTLGDNYCTKVDRASMAYAIEVRSPFMDYRLIEYSQKIPSNMKVNIIKTKILLRELVKDIVPKQILNLKKHGFGAPINQWFKRINFNPSSSESLRYIEKINPYWKNIFLEEKSDETLNMRLYFFNLWCKRWIKE